MPILERINPDNLNIHQFQEMPEISRPELPFDPQVDIPQRIRDRMIDVYKDCIDGVRLTDAAGIKILLNMDFSKPDEQKIRSGMPQDEQALNYAVDVKILDPNFEFSDSEWHNINNSFRLKRDESYVRGLIIDRLEYIAMAKIVGYQHDQMLTSSEIEKAKQSIQNMQDNNNLDMTIDYMKNLRLIDPSYKPEISEEQWEHLTGLLKTYEHSSGATSYIKLATDLKILAAHSVRITAPGVIEFQMYPPADVNHATPPMPEPRKF